MKRLLWLPWLVAALLLQGGCSFSSPSTNFYTLAGPSPETDSVTAAPPRLIIALGPIELADYLDRPEIVTRDSDYRLQIDASDRWGGSLRSDLSLELREQLNQLLAPGGLRVVAWEEPVAAPYRLQLNVERFEAVASATVVLRAHWLLLEAGTNLIVASGSEQVREPIVGAGRDAAIAAMSQALTRLGRQLATRIQEAPLPR